MLHAYKTIYSTVESLAMIECVTSENNHNLTHLENILLQWHFKLGYTFLSKVNWIGGKFWIGNMGYNM